jgi:hypothetical protein
MARPDANVKGRNFLIRTREWVDNHPRTGWYVAGWAVLVSLNTAIGLIDTLLRLVG